MKLNFIHQRHGHIIMHTELKKNKKRHRHDVAIHQLMPSSQSAKQILQERASRIAEVNVSNVASINEIEYIRFQLSNTERYGIDYKYVKEIIFYTSISKLPYLPNYVAGIINHRGALLTIIDLKTLFQLHNDLSDKEENSSKYILITETNNIRIGLIIYDIDGNDSYELSKLDQSLAPAINIKSEYILGLHNSATILNFEVLVSDLYSQLAKQS